MAIVYDLIGGFVCYVADLFEEFISLWPAVAGLLLLSFILGMSFASYYCYYYESLADDLV